MTLWDGTHGIRDYYNARIGRHNLFGFPTPNPMPAHPYLPADAITAHNTRTLPPHRDANGNLTMQPPAVRPIVPPVLQPVIPPVLQPMAPPVLQPMAPPVQPRADTYPYPYWPAVPWDADPGDDTLRFTTRQINNRQEPGMGDSWVFRNDPGMWPVGDESRWRGAKFLGGGSYGSAGLWCELNPDNSIARVGIDLSAETLI